MAKGQGERAGRCVLPFFVRCPDGFEMGKSGTEGHRPEAPREFMGRCWERRGTRRFGLCGAAQSGGVLLGELGESREQCVRIRRIRSDLSVIRAILAAKHPKTTRRKLRVRGAQAVSGAGCEKSEKNFGKIFGPASIYIWCWNCAIARDLPQCSRFVLKPLVFAKAPGADPARKWVKKPLRPTISRGIPKSSRGSGKHQRAPRPGNHLPSQVSYRHPTFRS